MDRRYGPFEALGTSSGTLRHDVSLRVKLVISFTVLLLVAIVTVGFVASRSIRTILVAQTDRTLVSFTRDPRPRPEAPASFGTPNDEDPPADALPREDREPFLRSVAEVFIAADGTVVFVEPSGFADNPDPLPDVSNIGGTEGFVNLDSVDGSLEYRAYVQPFPDGVLAVRAAPLSGVATAQNELVRTLLLAGLAVLLIGGSVTWWMVRRAMRPVDEMVDTAEAIAHGDLARRVPDADPNTELGRLGESLNDMLAAIEHSLETERDGRERLRRFVGDASHELRTPLTTIAGYAELQRKGALTDRDAENNAWGRVDSEGKRMKRLVEDLLTLTRLGQTMPLDLADVDVAAICRDAAADFAAGDPDRTVRLTGVESVIVTGDSGRLHQVVANLLSNVTTHTPEGTVVTVDVHADADGCAMTVADDGSGIPADAIDHVFDRFYRVDRSRSRDSGGSGLGLAIVDAIVSAHSGTVGAANGPLGGAVFTVRLPRVPHIDDIHRATDADSQRSLSSPS